jgi:hypothetical protein
MLHGDIAFAGSLFQAAAIEDGDCAPDVFD